MKIVHFESGLGNQMLNYAEYLAIKFNYSDVYIEKMIYETLPYGKGICQWNGYELERVFGIKLIDISTVIGAENYKKIKDKLIESKYWENNWKYAKPIVSTLNSMGYKIDNLCYRGTNGDKEQYGILKQTIKNFCFKSYIGNYFFRFFARIFEKKIISKSSKDLFIKSKNDFYCGQSLNFMFKNHNIEKIEKKLRKDFIFKNITKKNIEYSIYLQSINSVCIHARRGDFLSRNSFCYKYGYFKRAVNYIKKHVENPVFVFFCDTNSIEWVKKNLKAFGIKINDSIEFVDWNINEHSYEDLFLMSKCKHNIITQSSFGWWGSFLNENPNKITISPDCRINTTNWM